MKYLSQLPAKNLKNKVCLLRLDFNTADNWRLEASLPTLKFLTENCRAVVVLSHKGRPAGFNQSLTLRPVTQQLTKLLKRVVIFVPHFRFLEIKELIKSSPRGSLFLLENLRFLKEENENNNIFAEHLASLGDIFVNDAFAVSHRANSSVAAITKHLPNYAGLGLESEIKNLSRIMKNPAKPLVVILGGLKIEDKLNVIKNLKKQTSAFLIGGALDDRIIAKLQKIKKIVLPIDFKYNNRIIRDIGPKSIAKFLPYIEKAGTILWNGPLGNTNKKLFETGTKMIAKGIAGNKRAFKAVGGGETVMYLKKLKLDKKMNFISTGGGAMLEFLAGKDLPGIKALK